MSTWRYGAVWRRFILIEIGLFTAVAIFCDATQFDYASALFIIGLLIIIMALSGSGSYARVGGVPFYDRNRESNIARDLDQMGRLQMMATDGAMIGVIPLVASIIMLIVNRS